MLINHSSGWPYWPLEPRCRDQRGIYIYPDGNANEFPNMLLRVHLRLTAYALLVFARTVLLVVLRRRFRQRCLWNIPGSSNASLVWGNIPISETTQIVYSTDHDEGHYSWCKFNPDAYLIIQNADCRGNRHDIYCAFPHSSPPHSSP
jgi:hypothetical protein